MFGLEDQKKKKKSEEALSEFEKSLKDPKKFREIKDIAENKIQKLKHGLQTGENPEDFNRYGLLLHGYISLLKVMARTLTGKK